MKDSALNQLLGSTAWKYISIVHESSKCIDTHTHTHTHTHPDIAPPSLNVGES
jgi:hypothetical protein